MAEQILVIFKNISELNGYERNTRTHSEEQIEQIAASIQEYGWTNPVLIDEDTPGVDIDYMTFCRKRIPLSDIEASALMSRLESFVEKNGSLFGFVTQLLTEGADA